MVMAGNLVILGFSECW